MARSAAFSVSLLVAAILVSCAWTPARAMISKSGHYVPPELRRNRELDMVNHMRSEIQKKLETAEGNELLDLQNQLLELEQVRCQESKRDSPRSWRARVRQRLPLARTEGARPPCGRR